MLFAAALLLSIPCSQSGDPFLAAAHERMTEMERMIDRVAADAKAAGAEAPAPFRFFLDDARVPRPYLLAVQDVGVPRVQAAAEHVGRLLDALRRTFYERYAAVVPLRDLTKTPLPVQVFASRGQYERWRRFDSALPPSDRARCFALSSSREGVPATVYLWLIDTHEELTACNDPLEDIKESAWNAGTYQLLDFSSVGSGRLERGSPWMDAGMASYVSSFASLPDATQPDGWRYFFGLPNLQAISELNDLGLREKDQYNEEAPVPLRATIREIVQLEYPAYLDARRSIVDGAETESARIRITGVRAIGWALCHFLQEGKGGAYRDRFHEWFRDELAAHPDRSAVTAFERIFGLDGDARWKEFENDVQNHVALGLRRDRSKLTRRDLTVFEDYSRRFALACRR